MNVNIKRLSPDAQTPTYAHATDAGFDLVAAADVIIEPGLLRVCRRAWRSRFRKVLKCRSGRDPALR